MADKEIKEAKSLRWLAVQFPKVENPKDDVDRMQNCINLYCTNAADLINNLQADKEALIAGQETMQKHIECLQAEIEQYKARVFNDTQYIEKIEVENNKQRAEIKMLNNKVNSLKKYDKERDIALHSRLIATARAEAIKEFVEILKENSQYIIGYGFGISTNQIVYLAEKKAGES